MEIDEIKKILKEEVFKNNTENIHFVIKQIDSLFNNNIDFEDEETVKLLYARINALSSYLIEKYRETNRLYVEALEQVEDFLRKKIRGFKKVNPR